jgi:hypothetical protein
LGVKQSPAQPASVACERDAGLDRLEAAGAVFGVAGAEGVAVLAEPPGDAHERVAVLGQTLAADASATGHGRGLVGRRREPCCRVQLLGRGPALDRQRVGRERGGADDGDPGQRREDLAGGLGQQRTELGIGERDVVAQVLPAAEIAPRRAARSSLSEGGFSSRFQRPTQNAAVASVMRPAARASKERLDGARPANAAALARTA